MSVCSRWVTANSSRRFRSARRPGLSQTVRAYATGTKPSAQYDGPRDIAILGGGITGLSAAHHLINHEDTKDLRITIFESQPTLGGWIKSEFVDVPGGKVLLEKGPRTLRPAGVTGLLCLHTIHELGLEEELLSCSKDSPAARNRFVYYPDHLVRMPSKLTDIPRILTEPLFEGLVQGILKDILVRHKEPVDYGARTDATVAEKIADRLHPKLVNLISAVLHGIYAGDVSSLSFGALLPSLDRYIRNHGHIVQGMLHDWQHKLAKDEVWLPEADINWIANVQRLWRWGEENRAMMPRIGPRIEALRAAHKSSVFSFRDGMQRLPDKMAEELRNSDLVTIETDCTVSSVSVQSTGSPHVVVKTPEDGDSGRQFTHVISTLSGYTLAGLLGYRDDGNELTAAQRVVADGLCTTGTVDVMVVNLWYPQPDLLPVKGFGYLIPKDVPVEQNPELGLGVVFDSDAIQGQDTVPGTKLTVMLGGHYWNGTPWAVPSELEAISNAKSLVARHLGIRQEPVVTKASFNQSCIPQYAPNHRIRLSQMRKALMGDEFKSRLIVAGASYDGVGVNDCIRSGQAAGLYIRNCDSGPVHWGTPRYRPTPTKNSRWSFE